MNEFNIENIPAYYNRPYIGFGKIGNPNFLNVLKDTFSGETNANLQKAKNNVKDILRTDIPLVIKKQNIDNPVLVIVPRAKARKSYFDSQLQFLQSVKEIAKELNLTDGTDYIIRIKDTRTTHLPRDLKTQSNEGDDPYMGIIKDTCEINYDGIKDQNIILIDDIYTHDVMIDEDAIQTLFNHGAKTVTFYAIAKTGGDI